MQSLGTLALSASLTLTLLGDAWAAPGGRAGEGRLLMGELSAPAPGAAPPQAAARLLRQLRLERPGLIPDELGAAEVVPVGEGHVVRHLQRHRGVPIFGGELAVRVARDGRVVRLVRDVLDEEALARIDVTPRLPAEAAAGLVRDLRRGAVSAPALQIDGETARLVWVVPSFDLARLENALYLVDAHSGEVLRRIELLRFADQFRVFRSNPVVRPAAEAVSLPGGEGGPFSPAPGAPRPLSSPLLRANNCLDDGMVREVPGIGKAHLCAPQQTAEADVDGNFDGLEPLVDRSDGKCPTTKDANLNQFAEAHMYWHAAAIYDRFRKLYAGLGRADFKLRVSTGPDPRPLAMVVNLCIPDFGSPADPARPLRPLQNAFFSPGGLGGFNEVLTGQSTDALGFGMGRKTNFALDGDVIYHEFTHAVVYSNRRLVVSSFEDDHGPNTDPGAMNEGLADYFSSTLTGDPDVGEYAWRNFSDSGGGLRSLQNEDRCADDRIGQIHEDSKAFSGALWDARRLVAGEPGEGGPAAGRRDLFDQAVLAAVDGSGSRPSMTDMARLVLQELAMRAQQLGAEAQAKAEQAFTAHGLLPECDRVIRELRPKPLLCLDGIEGRGSRKLMAGHVQWRVEVPATADTLTVKLDTATGSCTSTSLSDDPPAAKLKLAMVAGEEPLTWQRDEGSQDELLPLLRSGGVWEATVPVKKGVYHFMIVNAGGSVLGQNIRFTLSCAAPAGCKAEEPKMERPGAAGCGCRVGGRPDAAAGLGASALVGLLGLLLRRRR